MHRFEGPDLIGMTVTRITLLLQVERWHRDRISAIPGKAGMDAAGPDVPEAGCVP